MAGPKVDIQDLAYWNPRVALAIMRGDVFEPLVFNVRAEFTVTAVGTRVEGSFDTPPGNVQQDSWIDDSVYTVETPNANTGSIFRAQQQWFNQLNPGVDVDVTVFGSQDYKITPRVTPIQNVFHDFACCWPSGWTLFYQHNLQIEFFLTRALIPLVDGVGETPYRIIVTLRGWRLGCQDLVRTGTEEARQILRDKYNVIPRPAAARPPA